MNDLRDESARESLKQLDELQAETAQILERHRASTHTIIGETFRQGLCAGFVLGLLVGLGWGWAT